MPDSSRVLFYYSWSAVAAAVCCIAYLHLFGRGRVGRRAVRFFVRIVVVLMFLPHIGNGACSASYVALARSLGVGLGRAEKSIDSIPQPTNELLSSLFLFHSIGSISQTIRRSHAYTIYTNVTKHYSCNSTRHLSYSYKFS